MNKRYEFRIMLLLAVGIAGCQPKTSSGTSTGAPVGATRPSTAVTSDTSPDLTKGINWMSWAQNGNADEPLTMSHNLAQSAGGTWLVLAPRPLDSVKSPAMDGSQLPANAAEFLTALRKAGTPLGWETQSGYTLLNFDKPQTLAGLRAKPPQEIVGVYLAAPDGEAMLHAVGDLWKVKIQTGPDFFKERNALLAARKASAQDDTPQGAFAIYTSAMTYGAAMPGSTDDSHGLMEFSVVERMKLDEFMSRLAAYFAADAKKSSDGQWQFTRWTDAKKITAEIARLKAEIEESNAAPNGFSSFASRRGGDFNPYGGAQEMGAIPPLSEKATAALDNLTALGPPAVPAIIALLNPAKPAPAQGAMQVLSELNTSQGNAALLDFARQLQKPAPKKEQSQRALLQTALVRLLARNPDEKTATFLGEVACDINSSSAARKQARLALIASGNLAPFENKGQSADPNQELSHLSFNLPDPNQAAVKPAPKASETPANKTKKPIATLLSSFKLADGDTWAVFLSGHYGDENDMWLARHHAGQWSEFLFVNQTFELSAQYAYLGAANRPKPGSCALKINGDQVIISPPGVNVQAKLNTLMKTLQNPKFPAAQREKLTEQYTQLAMRNISNMQKTLTFKLTNLRRDTDKDGLTDLAETRLGLSPEKPDTDGDGTPDGKDANPLAASSNNPADREQLLQATFTALYGGEPAEEPLIVLLEHSAWQAFDGAHSPVLCMTKEDYSRRIKHLGSLRVLQFGGPADDEATILQKDGPCLFNEARNKAEIHLWQLNLQALSLESMASGRSDFRGLYPVDYIARFEKSSGWKLTSFKPWRFDSADKAIAEYSKQQMANRGMVY